MWNNSSRQCNGKKVTSNLIPLCLCFAGSLSLFGACGGEDALSDVSGGKAEKTSKWTTLDHSAYTVVLTEEDTERVVRVQAGDRIKILLPFIEASRLEGKCGDDNVGIQESDCHGWEIDGAFFEVYSNEYSVTNFSLDNDEKDLTAEEEEYREEMLKGEVPGFEAHFIALEKHISYDPKAIVITRTEGFNYDKMDELIVDVYQFTIVVEPPTDGREPCCAVGSTRDTWTRGGSKTGDECADAHLSINDEAWHSWKDVFYPQKTPSSYDFMSLVWYADCRGMPKD